MRDDGWIMRTPTYFPTMNRIFCFAVFAVSIGVFSCSAEKPADTDKNKATEAKGEAIFNGKDLTNWDGDPAIWTVEDGVLTGTITAEAPLEYNRFLIYTGEPVEDFKLTVEIRLTGDSNTGIQYRSKVRPELGDHVVSGYQCDMHPAEWANGMLYEEKERGILAKRGQKVVLTEDGAQKVIGKPDGGSEQIFDPFEWHTYTIEARGNHLMHAIDGVTTVEIFDHDVKERDMKGTIAIQVHKGPPMKVEVRKALLERLEPAGLILPAATPVPDGAEDVNPPKGPAKGKEGKEGKGKGAPKDNAKGKGNAAAKSE